MSAFACPRLVTTPRPTQGGPPVPFPTQTGTPRYQSLDLFRGIFCLFVVLEHLSVALWTGHDYGVGPLAPLRTAIVMFFKLHIASPMFFVISGFCMVASLESCRRNGQSAWYFLGRRTWRIFPPYWAAVAVFALIVSGLDRLGLESWHRNSYSLELASVSQLTAAQWLGNLSLTEIWRPFVMEGEPLLFTRVAWTLCYQEQFYLIGGLTMLVCVGRLHLGLALVTGLLLAVGLMLFDVGSLPNWDGLFLFRWHLFAAGMIVYWRLYRVKSRSARLALDLTLAVLMVGGFWNDARETAAAGLFALLLVALRKHDATLASLAATAPLRACGRISYSIYLTHLPICILVASALNAAGVTDFWPRLMLVLPLGLLASIAFGWVFDRMIDRQFARLPDWLPRAHARGSALVAGPVQTG